jgi:hypothetical protein
MNPDSLEGEVNRLTIVFLSAFPDQRTLHAWATITSRSPTGECISVSKTIPRLHGIPPNTSFMVQILGWLRAEAACASRLKTSECLRVTGNFLGQELEGDKAMQLYILSFIDHTHPAAAQRSRPNC